LDVRSDKQNGHWVRGEGKKGRKGSVKNEVDLEHQFTSRGGGITGDDDYFSLSLIAADERKVWGRSK